MKKRVLVFPCGSEVGLEIHRSLRFSKDFELVGASSVSDHGKFVYDNYIPGMPFVDDSDFMQRIEEEVRRNSIDFIFPAHDSVVLKLAKHANSLSAIVVTSPLGTCEVVRSKRATYNLFKGLVRVPNEYGDLSNARFPVFLKPDVGQGSRGVHTANSPYDVEFYRGKDPSLMALEYLPGEEYTVDCFTDKNGELLFAQPRIRSRVSNGISVNSRTVEGKEFISIAQKVNSILIFRGVWFFQMKRDRLGELTLLEIAPRVAGAMAFSRIGGVNLPLLSLYDAIGLSVVILKNTFTIELDSALQTKYKLDITFAKVYIDLDDTIIYEGRINHLLIALLYKFREENKKIILITKHIHTIDETLKSHKIEKTVFDQIISLGMDENKSHYVKQGSVFIDDSFAERKDVLDNTKVPVFDVGEAVELL